MTAALTLLPAATEEAAKEIARLSRQSDRRHKAAEHYAAEVGRLEAQIIIERSATNAAVAEVGRLRLLLLEAAVRLEKRGADLAVVARLRDEAGP